MKATILLMGCLGALSACGTATDADPAAETSLGREVSVLHGQSHDTRATYDFTIYEDGSYVSTTVTKGADETVREWYQASTGDNLRWIESTDGTVTTGYSTGSPPFRQSDLPLYAEMGGAVGWMSADPQARKALTALGVETTWDPEHSWITSYRLTDQSRPLLDVSQWTLDSLEAASAPEIESQIEEILTNPSFDAKPAPARFEPIPVTSALATLSDSGWDIAAPDGYHAVTAWQPVDAEGRWGFANSVAVSDLIAIDYRNGLDSITVMSMTSKPQRDSGPLSARFPNPEGDPLGVPPEYAVPIASGPFSQGQFAEVSSGVGEHPSAWLVDDSGHGLLVIGTGGAADVKDFVEGSITARS